MNVTCDDRERIFEDGMAEEWVALEAHAGTCMACAEELRGWREISRAAAEMRDYREQPALWKSIEAALIQQVPKRTSPGWKSLLFWRYAPQAWQLAWGGALVLALALAGGYLLFNRGGLSEPTAKGQFLKDQTLAEVERTERDYRKAIDRLASEAKPQMEANASPLVMNYQEKLMVLDGAIDELRLQAGNNPSNAHLRTQLLAMYQAKEATLQEILEMKR